MKKGARIFLFVSFLAALAAAAWAARAPLHRWQQRRLLAASQAFLQQGNLRSAYLSARQALQNEPNSAPACALLAQIADAARSPEAVLWRERLVQLFPDQPVPLFDLAATALRLGENFTAEQALARVPAPARQTRAYHEISAGWAIATRQPALADEHLQKAIALAPKDESLQLSLATLRLAAGKTEAANDARKTLEQLKKKTALHQAAVRALLSDARKNHDDTRALALAAELKNDPRAGFDDDLLFLEELHRAHDARFDDEWRALQKKYAGDAGKIYGLMTWMNANGLAARTIEWSITLPLRGQMPVPLALAEAYAALGDWERLRGIAAEADWGELDFIRFAIHARAIDEISRHARGREFQTKWERAVNSTSGDPNKLSMLARLIGGWGWRDDAIQIWWRIANGHSGQRPALKELHRIYLAEKNTRGLYRAGRRLLQIEPANLAVKNNVAMLALLLGEDTAQARQFAEENFRIAPTDPAIASTQAFSLFQQNKTRDALAVLAPLPEEKLREPSIAACYGALLAANGETEKAKPFLEIAEKNESRLLPEEIAFVENASHSQ